MPNTIVFSGLNRIGLRNFAEITTIHPLGNTAIREAAADCGDFPVIAAADPLGGAAVRPTAAVQAANQFQRFHHCFSSAWPNCWILLCRRSIPGC